ncbi:fimbrillin family protein [uncultured Parabacteroides sp.]|uniref:fimbrillin family protein n=1 Tax=uncultured Parabacteroides sp. TaxID=512312 RepID=UPI00259AD6CB|nr:fimbrillin family protein [uncultured Parabacteroides sp.]
MKPYNYLLLPILTISLLTSCSKEEDIDNPVSLTLRVAGVSLTRAAVNDASDLTSVGIYAVNAETTEQTYGIRPAGIYGKYKPATANGITSLVPENAPTDQTIWLNNEKAIIFSCHPAPANGKSDIQNYPTASSTDPVPTVPVPVAAIEYTSSKTAASNQVDLTQPKNDYMYGVEYKNNTYQENQPYANNGNNMPNGTKGPGQSVSIGLKHVFAKLRLIIKKEDSYKGTAAVTSVKYTSKIPVPGNNTRMKLTNGELLDLDNTATDKSYTYTLTSATATTDVKTTLTITNYAIPCSQSLSGTISLIVDGKPMSVACTNQWERGKIYTYTVTIKPTGLELSGINVVGWQDAAQIPDTNI